MSRAAATVIDREDSELLFSDVSALEITLKWSADKLGLPSPPRQWIESQISVWSLTTIAITRNDIYRASELPSHHRDPFDRLLIAIALNHGATIVTPDAAVQADPVAWQW